MIELALVPGMNEELHMRPQGLQAARETTGASHQSGQIVTKLGVARLDAVGLDFIGTHFMTCLGVMQFKIDVILVAEWALSSWGWSTTGCWADRR